MKASSDLLELRALVKPVFIPSLVYSVGTSALVPAQVLLALQSGFSPAGVTGVMTWIGAFAILSSVVAGQLVERLGERLALLLTTGAGGAGLVVAASWCAEAITGARWVLVVALTIFDLVDAVWSIARQGLVADKVHSRMRGRAMNVYGACQRIGRIGGPLIAAAVLAVTGPAAVLPIVSVIVVVALALLLRTSHASEAGLQRGDTPVRQVVGVPGGSPWSGAGPTGMRVRGLWWRHRIVLLGVGVLSLQALRTAKETLVPLWATQGVHLDGAGVALLLALTSGAEIALFWPAGLALDRYGRAPVVVTALALMGTGLCLAPLSHTASWLVVCVTLIGLGDGIGAGLVKILGIDLAPESNRAAFLGRWQAIASAGSLLAPLIAGAAVALASLGTALALNGAAGVAGALWMAWWTPKLIPGGGKDASGTVTSVD